jgi:hypothetical protein
MLVDFKNDLFATHKDMGYALRYVNDLCSTADSTNSLAIRTAAQIILNTAIEMHRAEKQVLVDKINEMSARANPVTALLTLVREQVTLAVAEQSHAVTAAVDEQIDEKIDNWMRDNLSEKMDEHIDDIVSEQISEYFNSNSFSIQPN